MNVPITKIAMERTGRDGLGVITGDGAPDPAAGRIGELYIDLANVNLYGPKSGLAGWGGPTSLAGNSWSPVIAAEDDGARSVLKVVDWVGGQGTKPASPVYIGSSGLVSDIADASNVRGAQGEATAAQGAKADTAVQPGDLAAVATTGDAAELSGTLAAARLDVAATRSHLKVFDDCVFLEEFGGKPNDGSAAQVAANDVALAQALATGRPIILNEGIWYVSAPQTVRDQNAVTIRGRGCLSTRFVVTDPDITLFDIAHSETPARTDWMICDIGDFGISFLGAGIATTGRAFRLESILGGQISNMRIEGYHIAYDLVSCGHMQLHNLQCQCPWEGTGTGILTAYATFIFREKGFKGSFGHFMSNCEVWGGAGVENVILIHGNDGLYVTNCHFNKAKYHLHLWPNQLDGAEEVHNKRIFSIRFNQVYFDADGADVAGPKFYVESSGSAANTNDISRISFNGCEIRGGAGAWRFNTAPGGLQGLWRIELVSFSDCEFGGQTAAPIDLRVGPGFSAKTLLQDFRISGGFAYSSNTAEEVAILAGKGALFSDFKARGTYAIGVRIASDSVGNIVDGFYHNLFTPGSTPTVVDAGAEAATIGSVIKAAA
ncbi:hypothetical protein L1787_18515 [Acuticoccus sp. M5D2P5]|uniref:hypothetical protein n=1 Tax=Acuticoccus kalidii TaxID=2910977 RepID=UPI001F36C499|nr:hypothetical protein [Acuticoccus kalidii]MCF3935387.1 hypothetical protein [Acuticoccus kalidii]